MGWTAGWDQVAPSWLQLEFKTWTQIDASGIASKLFWVITALFCVSGKAQAWWEAWVEAGRGERPRFFFFLFPFSFFSVYKHARAWREAFRRLGSPLVGLAPFFPPLLFERFRSGSEPFLSRKAAPTLPAAARAPGGGDGTPSPAAWQEFIAGWLIHVCYVGWFGCLLANFRCYANAAPSVSLPKKPFSYF